MTEQTGLFEGPELQGVRPRFTFLDIAEGDRAKRMALDLQERQNGNWVEAMRRKAREIARRKGSVTTDDLRAYAVETGYFPRSNKAFGAVFKGKEWVLHGWTLSAIPTSHSRCIRVWRLR